MGIVGWMAGKLNIHIPTPEERMESGRVFYENDLDMLEDARTEYAGLADKTTWRARQLTTYIDDLEHDVRIYEEKYGIKKTDAS